MPRIGWGRWTVAVTVGAVVVAVACWLVIRAVATNGPDGGFYLGVGVLLAAGIGGGQVAEVTHLRTDGTMVSGRSWLGRRGVEVTRLVHVSAEVDTDRGLVQRIVLQDDGGRLTVPAASPVLDVVTAVLRGSGSQHHCSVDPVAARHLGVPGRPGRPPRVPGPSGRHSGLVVLLATVVGVAAGVFVG